MTEREEAAVPEGWVLVRRMTNRKPAKRHLRCGPSSDHTVCGLMQRTITVNRDKFKQPKPNDCKTCRQWLKKNPTC